MMIDTPRLTLRQFQLKDLSSLHYYRNHPVCKKFQNWEDTTLEKLDVFIKSNMQRSVHDQQMQIALALKETNELVGDIFLAKKGKTITLGFTTSPHFQRQGYMFEALSHFIPYLQDLFPVSDIICLIHPGNIASEHLVAKLHFEKEGYIDEFDSNVFVLKAKQQN